MGREAGVGFREVWAARRFRWLVAVRLTGAFAIGMVQAALATYVLFSPERAETPTKVAVSFAVLLLPYSVIGPFAGVLLDRLWRRQVLVYAFLLQGALALVLALLAHRGADGLDLALSVLFLLGANRFVLAALSAGTPHVVPAPYLVTANAVAPTLGTAAGVLGGLVGVLARAAAGGGDHGSVVVLIAAALTCAATSVIASRLRRRELGPSADEGRDSLRAVATGLLHGLQALGARPRAARAMALVSVQRGTFGILVALAVLQTRNALHGPGEVSAAVGDLTLATACAGAGALLGAVITPAVAHRIGARAWSSAAVAVGTALGAAALSTVSLPGLLLAGFAVGAGGQAAKVCTDTIVQAEMDDDHRGRVFAIYDMSVNVAIVAGVTFAVLAAPRDGGGALVPVVMAVVGVLAAGLSYRAGSGDNAPLPAAERTIR